MTIHRFDPEHFFNTLGQHPPALRVGPGDTVTWENEGQETHTVKGDGFFSRAMNAGDTFEHKFDKKGSYDYVCTLHPQMQGTVVVG